MLYLLLLLLYAQDILSRFHGAWELKAVRNAAGEVVGCDAELTQDVLPHGETWGGGLDC